MQTEVFASSPGYTGHWGTHETDSYFVCLYTAFVYIPQHRKRYPVHWGSIASLLPSALKLTVKSDCFSLQPVIWRLLQVLDPFGARYFQFKASTYLFMTGFILISSSLNTAVWLILQYFRHIFFSKAGQVRKLSSSFIRYAPYTRIILAILL